MAAPLVLHPDRLFSAEPRQRALARALYATVKDLPIVSPHGHTDPQWFANNEAFTNASALFITPDHYVFRMLYSQGIPLEHLGIPSRDGTPVETDHRRIWQRFAEHFYLFRGTPSGLWLADELVNQFGVEERLNGDSAQRIYDHLEAQLTRPEFAPRALLDRFKIELLSTTDAASRPSSPRRRSQRRVALRWRCRLMCSTARSLRLHARPSWTVGAGSTYSSTRPAATCQRPRSRRGAPSSTCRSRAWSR